MEWHTAYIGLGSNIGDRKGFIVQAVDLLMRTPGVMLQDLSNLRETEPVGMTEEAEPFLNGIMVAKVTLSPVDLLDRMRSVEERVGRPKGEGRGKNRSRVIDLDLIMYDSVVSSADEGGSGDGIVLPHPRMHERGFVLEPLAEVAPDVIHPVLGVTVAHLWEQYQRRG